MCDVEGQLTFGYMCNYQYIHQTFISRPLWLQLQQNLTASTTRKLESCLIYLEPVKTTSKSSGGASSAQASRHVPSWARRKEQIFWNTTGDVFEWQYIVYKIRKLIPA